MKWEKVKLGDVCEITSSKRIFYSEYVDDGVPFYRSKEIIESDEGKAIENPLYISVDKYNEIKEKFGVPQTGDMLLTSVGTIGIPYIIKKNDCFYFKDGNLTWFREFRDGLNSKYLYYWVKSSEGTGILYNATIGSSQKALTISALKNIKISLPPRSVQDKIVEVISAYDDLIENNQKQIELLEEAAQRLYKEWFVDLRFPGHEDTKIVDGVPEGWRRGLLKELISVNYGKDHKKAPDDGNIPVYGSGGLMRKCNKSLFSGEAVLIPRKGSLNNIMYVDETFWTVDTMFYATMKQPHTAVFVYFFVKAFDMYSMNIGAAVPSMTAKILDAMDVVIPDKETLEKFDKRAKTYFNKIKTLQGQNERLKIARDLLLPKLMSGEVEV